jgi:hypothetical protein
VTVKVLAMLLEFRVVVVVVVEEEEVVLAA